MLIQAGMPQANRNVLKQHNDTAFVDNSLSDGCPKIYEYQSFLGCILFSVYFLKSENSLKSVLISYILNVWDNDNRPSSCYNFLLISGTHMQFIKSTFRGSLDFSGSRIYFLEKYS